MDIIEKKYIEVTDNEIQTLLPLMIKLLRSIKKSNLSSTISVKLSKEEKEEARELLEAFLKIEFEDANIESDDYQR